MSADLPDSTHPYHERVRSMRSSSSAPSRQLMQALDDLGVVTHSAGRPAEAIGILGEARVLAEHFGTADDRARITRRLANCYQDLGHFTRATELYDACRPSDDAPVAERFGWTNSRAHLAEREDDPEMTSALYARSVALFDGLPRPYGRAIFGLSNAAMWFASRDIPEAERLLRKFRRCARAEHTEPPAFEIAVIRAAIAETKQQFALADRHWRKAAAAASATGQESLLPSVAVERAGALRRLGRAREATTLLRSYMTSAQPAASSSPIVAVATTLGSLLVEEAEVGGVPAVINEAASCLRQALAGEAQRGMPDAEWRILSGLADLAAVLGQPAAAILLGKASIRSIRNLSESDAIVGDRDQPRQHPYRSLIDRLVIAGRFAEAAHVQAMMMQENVFELLSRRPDADRRDVAVPLRASEESILSEYAHRCARLRGLRYESGSAGLIQQAAIVQQQEAEQANLSAWVNQLLDGGWNHRLLREEAPILAAHAAPDEVGVLHFLRSAQAWMGMLQTPGGTRHFEIGGAEEVSRTIYAFRQSIVWRSADWRDAGQELWRRLIEPVRPSLAGVKRLEIVPDGPFSFLPFAALYDGQRCLIEHFDLVMRTGLGSAQRRHDSAKAWRLLLLGSPGPAGNELLHVEKELNTISHLWQNARTRMPFTADVLETELASGADIVHIACHFTFDPGRPNRSSFELDGGERLTLAAFRSSRFDLSAVRLLVLSACDTAMTEEGTFGPESLAGVAQSKGVQHVVGTLWPVVDASTAVIMALFYEELAKQGPSSSSPEKALRAAQLALASGWTSGAAGVARSTGLGRPDENWRHPCHWAGYALFGAAA